MHEMLKLSTYFTPYGHEIPFDISLAAVFNSPSAREIRSLAHEISGDISLQVMLQVQFIIFARIFGYRMFVCCEPFSFLFVSQN